MCAEEARFGKFTLEPSQIFLQTKLTRAFVNLRPIVPGHVLVTPNRVVPRVADLSEAELTDLWQTVRKVQAALEPYYKASASNLAIQDGKGAGQSVPHVHVHVLPRVSGDFEENDEIYEELERCVWPEVTSDAHPILS